MEALEHGKMMVGKRFVGAWEWDRTGGAFGRLYETYDAALRTLANFKAKQAELAGSRLLTKEGKTADLRTWVAGNAIPVLAKARKVTLSAVQREVEERRAKLAFDGPDKADVAGALLRQEIRAHIRAMDPAKRTATLMADDVSPDVAMAVMEAPAELSGVTRELRESLRDKAIEAAHPGETAAVRQIETALETTDRAVSAAEVEMATALGLTGREFSAWVQGSTANVEPARLRRGPDGVKVIDKNAEGQLVLRPPRGDELETGVFVA